LEIIGEMKLLQAKKSQYLERNRVLNNLQTDVERMSTTEENLKRVIQRNYRACKRSVYFLQKKEQDEVAAGPVSESTQTSLTMTYKAEGKVGLEVVEVYKTHN
jgi:hypothetical protein